jgi:hypothetical protein
VSLGRQAVAAVAKAGVIVEGNVGVFNRRLLAAEHIHPGGHNVERNHLVVMGQQDSVGQAHVAGAGNGDSHEVVLRGAWLSSGMWVRASGVPASARRAAISASLRCKNRLVRAALVARPWGHVDAAKLVFALAKFAHLDQAFGNERLEE